MENLFCKKLKEKPFLIMGHRGFWVETLFKTPENQLS